MVIDSVSLTTVQDNNRPQNLDSGTNIKTPTRENELNRAGQASEAGPAVVTNFSAAALETSRATAETSQSSERNATAPTTERQPSPEQASPKIDVMV